MNATPKAMTTDDLLSFELDVLAQQPLLQIYTQLCFCFPLLGSADQSSIVATLHKGCERLAASFPWTAGQVVNEGASTGASGPYVIKGLGKAPPLSVKDLRDDPSAPTWDALREAEFPMRLLDEDVIAARRTLPIPGPPGGPGWSPSDVQPVFLIQANFLRGGGLILTFNGQHSVMDMTGQAEMIRLYSKACRGEEYSRAELDVGNMSRRATVDLFGDDFVPGPELQNATIKPQVPDKSEPESPPKATWAYFCFAATSIAALKSKASQDVPTGFVSSDDSLTAFIWQATARARAPRLEPSSRSLMARAVDMRKFVGVPESYTGLLQNMAYNDHTIEELMKLPLGVIAAHLRSQLDPASLLHRTRSLATYISRRLGDPGVGLTATVNPSSDVMLSSWSKVAGFDLDFNLGQGHPLAVLRPQFTPFESLMYLMPKRPDGAICAAVSLRDEDLERIKTDPEFTKYARFIG